VVQVAYPMNEIVAILTGGAGMGQSPLENRRGQGRGGRLQVNFLLGAYALQMARL